MVKLRNQTNKKGNLFDLCNLYHFNVELLVFMRKLPYHSSVCVCSLSSSVLVYVQKYLCMKKNQESNVNDLWFFFWEADMHQVMPTWWHSMSFFLLLSNSDRILALLNTKFWYLYLARHQLILESVESKLLILFNYS